MKNRIYFYTGTGNSLRIAKIIAEEVRDCEIIAITEHVEPTIPAGYERIGFVFPVYFQGLPKIVEDFIQNADFSGQQDTYFFAIATYGAVHGNALPQIEKQLNEQGISLHYGQNLRMFSNYVVMYNMSKNVTKETVQSEQKTRPIARDITNKRQNHIPVFNKLVHWYYQKQMSRVPGADVNFSVSDACVSCGRCKAVCASGNIIMEDGRPVFQHHCNQCVGCIQYCPKQAINYKTKTQRRRRYTHPDISFRELSEYYQNSQ